MSKLSKDIQRIISSHSAQEASEIIAKMYDDLLEKLRWIPVEEKLPEASPDEKDWWTSDIGEVFPYSKKCLVENEDGELFVTNYSILENCWSEWCGVIVKWRYVL